MKITFLILAHDQPRLCARLADRLLAQGAGVCLHADAASGTGFIEQFDEALHAPPEQVIRANRVHVHWGQWSMVQATLNGLEAIGNQPETPDYVYLVSGADYPLRPLAELEAFLQENQGREFIESVNARKTRWVTQGLQLDRWRYRHWISWKTHPALFDLQLRIQRFLGLRQSFPEGLVPHMGSQWWTLTWPTCAAILEASKDPALRRFFRTTWVPDELFFQTMVRRVVDKSWRIDPRHLTLYRFDDNGVPLVFHDDHADLLARQPWFFARKLSPRADRLRDRLDRKLADHGVGEATAGTDPKPGDIPSLSPSTPCLPEYDRHLEAHQQGLWGVRRMLRPDHRGRGDLAWNARTYWVVISYCRQALASATRILSEKTDMVVHGELMAADGVHLCEDPRFHAGYRAADTAIRDQAPLNLVADLVNDTPDRLVVYALRPGQALVEVNTEDEPGTTEMDIALLHASDPNARLLIIEPAEPGSTDATPADDRYGQLENQSRTQRQRHGLRGIADIARREGVPHRLIRLDAIDSAIDALLAAEAPGH